MPIWGRGVYSRQYFQARQGCAACGFTLLELLVTLVVLAVAAGMLVVKTRSSEPQQLYSEAQQLAAVLRLAQQEALLRGVPVRLVWTVQGYAFEHLDTRVESEGLPPRWLPVGQEPWLRPRSWRMAGVQGLIEYDGQTQNALVFDAGLAAVNYRVLLRVPPHRVAIESLGVQGFVVREIQRGVP